MTRFQTALMSIAALFTATMYAAALEIPAAPAVAANANQASAPATVSVGASLDDVRVFPNPWRADKHAANPITFNHLPAASTIKLFTVSGQFIKILDVDNAGSAQWDLTNDSNVKVASGLYLYVVSTEDGQDLKGKLAIIR